MLRARDLRRRGQSIPDGPSSFLDTLSTADRAALRDELLDELSESVASRAEVRPLSYYGTVQTGIGADHTTLFEAWYDDVMGLDPGSGGIKVLCPPGLELRSDGIAIRRRMMLDLQGSILRSTADAGSQALFAASGEHTAEFTLCNGLVATRNTVIEMEGGTVATPYFTGGLIPTVENLYVVSPTRLDTGWVSGDAPAADYFRFRSIDRLNMRGVLCYDAATALVIAGTSGTHRGSTQLTIDGFLSLYCQLGADLGLIDKIRANIDVSRCGSGILLRNGVHRAFLDRCHVEFHGHEDYEFAERNGRAFMLNMSSRQQDPLFQRCSATLASNDDAVAGFEHYASTGVTYSSQDMPNPVYEGCHSDDTDAPAGYKPVDLWGEYEWRGRWPFGATAGTHAQSSTVAKYNDGKVRPTGISVPASVNLLGNGGAVDETDYPTGTGAGTFSVVASTAALPGARDITLDGVRRNVRAITLTVGWHTLIVHALTASDDFFAVVAENFAPDYTYLVKTALRGRDAVSGQVIRVPFYVETAGSYVVGWESYAAGSKTAAVARVGVFKGHVNEFPGSEGWTGDYPSIASSGTMAVPIAPALRVTGTTTITNITAGRAGQEVTLLFAGATTVEDSTGNLRLAGNFATVAGAALKLLCDGTNWNELSRTTNEDVYPTIASASTLARPTARVCRVSGTTGITNITAGFAGQEVTLVFADVLTVTDGGNLNLAGNFVTAAGSTLSLVCNGTSWFETGRAANA